MTPRAKEAYEQITKHLAVEGVYCTLLHLSRSLGISKPAATKLVMRLRRHQWVEFRPYDQWQIIPMKGIEPFLTRLRKAVWDVNQGTPLDRAATSNAIPEEFLSNLRSYQPMAFDD